jgi:glycosyltransferase involved in cell wall biosynthesis
MALKELCVLVPCYNESKNIASLFELCESLVYLNPEIDFSFCLIENGSIDDTLQVLEENRRSVGSKLNIQLINIPKNLGLGFGLISGLKVLSGKNVCIIPADGKYAVQDISNIIAEFAFFDNPTLLVKGIRTFRNDPALIRLLSVSYTWWCNVLYRMMSKDINGLPKIFFNSLRIDELELLSWSACFDGSLLGLWRANGGAIYEAPLKFTQKLDGTSSWNGRKFRISTSMLREAFFTSRVILKSKKGL